MSRDIESLPATGTFLKKYTSSYQVDVGYEYLLESLSKLSEAKRKGTINRDDRKQLIVQWDELEANRISLLPKLRFPHSFRPAVVSEAHEFARKAKSLLDDTTHRIQITTESKAKNVEPENTIASAKRAMIRTTENKAKNVEPEEYTVASVWKAKHSSRLTTRTFPLISPEITYYWVRPRPAVASLMAFDNGAFKLDGDILSKEINVVQIEKQQLSGHPAAGGGFADVWFCDWTVDGKTQKVGVKVMQCTRDAKLDEFKKMLKQMFRESEIWKDLDHPNVLKFLGICDTYGMFPGIVSPWMSNGHVAKYLSDRSPNVTTFDRLSLLLQAASGLQYLHENDPPVVHADLKAANVLVDAQGNACLADFGLSRVLEGTTKSALTTTTLGAGSVRWMAPELFDFNAIPRPRRSLATDIYAFGGLMLELLVGHYPFHTYRNDAYIMMEIANGILPPRPNCAEQGPCTLLTGTCSPVCDAHWEYMNECWSTDPGMRPKIADVRAQLERFKNA